MKTKMMQVAALAFGLVLAGAAAARSDIKDGNALVKPVKDEKYSIDGVILGKAELYGYMGGLRDDEHITGIVLKRGGTDEQRRIIGVIAKTLGLKSFEQDGRDLKEIAQPQDTPAPPPIEPDAAQSAQPAGTAQPVEPAQAAQPAEAAQPAQAAKEPSNDH